MTRATVDHIHELARGMPGTTVTADGRVYQVSGRSFIFFRTSRPDAVDPDTGERYDDVIVFWVASDEEKQALVLDESTPFFTTSHFNGHPPCCSVAAGSASSIATSWPRSSTTPGWRGPASGPRQPGWPSASSADSCKKSLNPQGFPLVFECLFG